MYFATRQTDRKNKVQLNLASMIDVVFLLLIFFLVSAIITRPEAQLSPAIQTQEADRPGADFTPQIIRAELSEGRPVYRVGSRIVTGRAELVALLEQLPKDLGIFVQVQDAVPVGFAVAAVQACRDAGFDKVTYVPGSR